MKIILVTPPCSDPALPYGASPLLSAILKRAGYSQVIQRDVNLEAFDDLVQPSYLQEAILWIVRQIKRGLNNQVKSTQTDTSYRELVRMYRSADEVLKCISESRRILRDPLDFYNPSKLLFAKRIFHMACELLSAPYANLSFGKYSYSNLPYDTFEQIEHAITPDQDDVLKTYFQTVTIPSLLAYEPDVIGLSVPYFSQLLPAFLLARLIKDVAPRVHITMGGTVPTWGKHILEADTRFGQWVDSIAIGEADQTILELLEACEDKRTFDTVHNFLIYQNNAVMYNYDPTHKIDLNWLPTPDFASLPLDRYFAPKRIICMVPTRGCYYNLCTFCNYAFIKLAPYRIRDPKLVAQDVLTIQKQVGEDVFCFESDVMLPHYLHLLSKALLNHEIKIKWHAVARFEKGMHNDLFEEMNRAGCVRLYMGMESVNPRILKLMDKGTTRERIEAILDGCDRAGIAVEAGVFGKFPSETPEEADETYQFVKTHRDKLARCDVGEFRLLRGTPIAEHPEKFAIEILGDPDKQWYHLQFRDPTCQLYSDIKPNAMQKIQALYPEVALVDVPEDILYTARFGPNSFGRFLRTPSEYPLEAFDGSEIPVLSSNFLINRAYIANSGSVLFMDLFSELDNTIPAFASSEIALIFAIDCISCAIYPLEHFDVSVIELCKKNLTYDEICQKITNAYSSTKYNEISVDRCIRSLQKLLALGVITHSSNFQDVVAEYAL